MRFLRVVFVLALALGLQAACGRFHPQAPRYLDLLLVPVVWYGIAGSQRSGMLVGCTAGLIHDAWFQMGAFGMSGFKRTLLGWVLGGVGGRFDFNHPLGRLLGGFLASLVDSLMDIALRGLLDLERVASGIGEILIKATISGLLVVVSFSVADRVGRYLEGRGLA